MPLSLKDFTSMLRGLPADAPQEQVNEAAAKADAGTPFEHIWAWANKPLIGGKDSPVLAHEHGPDEGVVRRTAEDLGSSLTSPLSVATTALGVGAGAAGARGLLGISKAARIGEAALQAPLVAEGLHHVVSGESIGEKLGGALEAGLAGHGVKSSLSRLPGAKVAPALVEEAVAPHAQAATAGKVLPQGDELVRAFDDTGRKPSTSVGQSPAGVPQLTPEFLQELQQYHGANGGSSSDVVNGKIVRDAKYILSPFEDRQQILDQPPSEQDLRNYVAKNEDLLTKPGHMLGTWDNQGKHYLDVSVGENDLDKALALGKQHNQLAIFDAVNGKEIPIDAAPDPNAGAAAKPNAGANVPNVGGSTALAVAAPAASASIDDSDPNDPHQQLKHYGKVALDMLGLAGGASAMGAAIRKNPQTLHKAAAARGAAYILLGEGKQNWAKRMVNEGVAAADLPMVRANAEKILNSQLVKAEGSMTNTKKLMAHFEAGKPDMGWYDQVHSELDGLFGKDAPMMAHLLAATSSNATVKSNTSLALKAYTYIKTGRDLDSLKPGEGFLPAVLMQVKRVAAGEPLAGRKIDNFAKAIVGDPNAVVVDRWMMRAFGFAKHDAPTPHEYDVIETAVKELAQKAQVTPRQMQAAIWFSVKNKSEAAAGKVNEAPPYGQLLKEKLAQRPLPLNQ